MGHEEQSLMAPSRAGRMPTSASGSPPNCLRNPVSPSPRLWGQLGEQSCTPGHSKPHPCTACSLTRRGQGRKGKDTRCSLQVFMWVTRTKHNSLHSQCAAVPGKSLMVSLRAVLKAGSTSTRSELVTALLGRQREPQEAFKDGEFVSR